MIEVTFGRAGDGKRNAIIKTIQNIERDIIQLARNPFKLHKKYWIEYYLLAYRYYLEELDKLDREVDKNGGII